MRTRVHPIGKSNMEIRSLIFLFVSLLSTAEMVVAERGYFRRPSIHGDTIVFTAEGDLWRVSAAGGNAIRLTSHLEQELDAAISPDGRLVAYSASYEGPREIYVLPIDGGRPRRITYDGETSGVRVRGWSPEGRVLYATRRFSTLPNTQLVLVHPDTLQQERIPLAQASDADWTPKQRGMVFTRLAKQSSSTKRYHGGSVENLWIYYDGQPEAIPLTADYTGTSREPMIWNQRVYFASDRDGTMNLWSMKLDGTDLQQVTKHKGFDVMGPALDDGRIAYQLGADLMLVDLADPKPSVVSIKLVSDFEHTREKWIEEPMDYLDSYSLSTDGKRLAVAARGHVFVLPTGSGRAVQVTRKQGVRYRSVSFMPDSNEILALSDESGEMEFWQFNARGNTAPEQLTDNGNIFRYAPNPSPDGKWFAFTDKNFHLWIHDVEAGKTRRIDTSDMYNFYDLQWSHDSQWLAYVANGDNQMSRVWIWNTKDQTPYPVTSERTESYSPTWSPDGKWLYFLSDRNLVSSVRSPWGNLQPEPYFDKRTQIFQLALRNGLTSPFLAPNELLDGNTDNETPDAKNSKDSDSKEKREDDQKQQDEKSIEIELKGIMARISRLPVAAGNYDDLVASKSHLYWTSASSVSGGPESLMSLERKHDSEPVTVMSDIQSFELNSNRSKATVRKSNSLYVFDANGRGPSNMSKAVVSQNGWSFVIDPVAEWKQMLVDAWRMERDYFYDPNLHGANWKELLERHLPLVERVTDRAELNDLIEQLCGELEALHIYVRGGDHRSDDLSVFPSSLGAVLRKDQQVGGYVVDHIYRNDPDYPEELSPLARPEVDVKVGSIIQSINGVDVLSVDHINRLLRGQAGRQVLLTVKDFDNEAVRDVIVQPIRISQEAALRYDQWELTRREQVEKVGNGKIGYVHLRAMSTADIGRWARDFYPVFHKQGLIVDVRHNRGGNIDSWILEKLMRQAWFYWKPRVGKPYWNMQHAFRGHIVVLCNEKTASDGEAFSEGFRRLGLGKVIGTRTWGGEIWLSINNRLVDTGFSSAAQTGVYGPEGEWLIEGHGVDPDIVVDNRPHQTFEGNDAQLEAAIGYLIERIKEDPRLVPKVPDYPVRPGQKKTR